MTTKFKSIIFIAVFSLVLGLSWCNSSVKAQQNSTMNLLTSCVVHAIPLQPSGEMIKFLSILTDEQMAQGLNTQITDSCKAHGFEVKIIHRGNMIEYKYGSDIKIVYQLFLIPQQGSGLSDIQYYGPDGKMYIDNWFFRDQSKQLSLTKEDNYDDFELHSQIVAEMMKMDLYIPHSLSVRLSTNLMVRGSYRDMFFTILKATGLKVDKYFSATGETVYVQNSKKRKYRIINYSIIEDAYEVIPLW